MIEVVAIILGLFCAAIFVAHATIWLLSISNCNMPTSITVVQPDGTIWTASNFTQVTAPALPPPEDVEIDVVLSDGSTKFVPEPSH